MIIWPVTSSAEEDSQSSWSRLLVTAAYHGYIPLRQSRGLSAGNTVTCHSIISFLSPPIQLVIKIRLNISSPSVRMSPPWQDWL